jgi:hypothetical protein
MMVVRARPRRPTVAGSLTNLGGLATLSAHERPADGRPFYDVGGADQA